MNETTIIILIIFVALFITYKYILKGKNSGDVEEHKNTSRPDIPKPNKPVKNDRIVVIKNTDYSLVKDAAMQYCNMCNQEEYVIVPKLTQYSSDITVITFPYGLEFDDFRYFINFLYYPFDIEYNPIIRGWTTMVEKDQPKFPELNGKSVMFFVPENDNEYDNVFITSEDSYGYKLGFGRKDQKKLDKPLEPYERNNISLEMLSDKPNEEIS